MCSPVLPVLAKWIFEDTLTFQTASQLTDRKPTQNGVLTDQPLYSLVNHAYANRDHLVRYVFHIIVSIQAGDA